LRWICPCHEPFEAGPLEPYLCDTPYGHDRVPTFFWGPLTDQGSFEERLIAALRDFEYLFAAQPAILLSSATLILMGAWLQINIKKKNRVWARQRLS
jgi:hypothetical protein